MDWDDEQHPSIGGGNDTERLDLQLNREQKSGSIKLPDFLDETLIMGIAANPNDELEHSKGQIDTFFINHTDKAERAEYIKSVYQDRYTELIINGKRVGYKPQNDGLLMWDGASDIHGNITRLDNKLESLATAFQNCEKQLADIQTQMETAKSEVDRPFPQEQEYAEKSTRLKELNILLNMDEKDDAVLDYGPDEEEPELPSRESERER